MASELDLDRLEALLPISASGPWRANSRRITSETDYEFYIADGCGHSCNDAELIAALRNAAPALIAAAREAEKLRELLLLCEFSGKYPKCPVCDGGIEFGHAPDCRLAAAIA